MACRSPRQASRQERLHVDRDDPYQPIERKLGLTRALIEAMLEYPPRLLIVDLVRRLPGRVAVCMSITTDDEAIRKIFEPACAPIAARRARGGPAC